jgi:hypothetical protein
MPTKQPIPPPPHTWPKVSSAKLNHENHCLVYPVKGTLDAFCCESGWQVAGWSNAPYPNRMGGETKAIVFEKTSPASESIMDLLADLEPGLYWCHGDIELMDIRSNSPPTSPPPPRKKS